MASDLIKISGSFRNLFLASVGNNSTLSESQKLQYLKLSVKGEAVTLLHSIQKTNDNYKKAWNALTERYENDAALNKSVSQPVLKQESASGLRKLIDTTQQCIDTLQTLRQPLDKFWQLEELIETKPFTNEEIACENHFKRTHTRDSTSRFVVNFPFRDSSDELGSSRDTAMHRLQQIERRFSKKSLSNQYHKFMNDYLKLGHMELIPENEIDVPVFISHITQYPIPMEINFAWCLTDLQSPQPIQDFRLTRVAYDTASAPYLAIKCLQQLPLNEINNFPLASKEALNDFYVDDLMSVANSLSEALELQNQLTQMLSSSF
ncbi:uncharacterized protein LOC103569155 [Trichonephila clavipes]|nr:uncharacterized protein LOC103569155 [Trichonephila clavipes]